MAAPITVLVTLHGIGFQQAPLGGNPGYADSLHSHLSDRLPDLSRDPGPPLRNGPIYVQSHWPPDTNDSEMGLKRLGSWQSRPERDLDIHDAPLVVDNASLAHVALVYSHLEDEGVHLGSALETSAKALAMHSNYASIAGLVRLAVTDIGAVLAHHEPTQPGAAPPTHLLARRTDPTQPAATGLGDVLLTLENDVTTYVVRNDLRERVRGFVREALLRLCSRSDVGAVVVNAHSQGTVLAYDVLRAMPAFLISRIPALVTAGSPVRKYVTLFTWGNEVGSLAAIPTWMNFYDTRDPVGDPACPPADWRPGQPTDCPGADGTTLLQSTDASGALQPYLVRDHPVDNSVNRSGGGLWAHNYWDNTRDFVQPLADLLREVASR